MTGMELFEDERVVSRADLAAWLRQLAAQLESDGRIFYGAAGAVAVPDRVNCELEIEQEKGGSELSVEIELSWAVSPKATGSAERVSAADDEEDEEEEEEEGEEEEEEEEEAEPEGAGEVTAVLGSDDAGEGVAAPEGAPAFEKVADAELRRDELA